MSIYKYLRVKTAANWMSNADLPGRTLDDNDDLVKNIEKVYEEHKDDYDPVEDGPIYQDVNPIYQEPEKYGIPPEVAMAEREHYDNNKARWQHEYLQNLYNIRKRETDEALAAAVPGYSHTPPTAEEFIPTPIPYEDPSVPTPPGSRVEVSVLPDTPKLKNKKVDAHTATDAGDFLGGGDDDLDFLGKDMYAADNAAIAGASVGIQQQYAQLAAQRQQLMDKARKADIRWDRGTIDRCNMYRYRIEAQMHELIRQAKIEQGKDPGKPLHEEVTDILHAMGN